MKTRCFDVSVVLLLLVGIFIVPALAYTAETAYDAVWPRGKAVVKIIPPAKRLDDLTGKTVCELWDYLFRGDEVFPMLEKSLTERYSGIKFVKYDTFGSTHGGGEAKVLADLPAKMKQLGCDAVISAVGC